jgi:hypothetical protein
VNCEGHCSRYVAPTIPPLHRTSRNKCIQKKRNKCINAEGRCCRPTRVLRHVFAPQRKRGANSSAALLKRFASQTVQLLAQCHVCMWVLHAKASTKSSHLCAVLCCAVLCCAQRSSREQLIPGGCNRQVLKCPATPAGMDTYGSNLITGLAALRCRGSCQPGQWSQHTLNEL